MSPTRLTGLFTLILSATLLHACSYSIIIANKNGTAQADPNNHTLGFYNGKEVHIIDTVVPLSVLQDNARVIQACPIGGFHSVEYRITFGAMLRNTFTFGKRKSIKVRYVCLKNSN